MKPVPPARTMRPVMPGFPRIPQESLGFPAVDKRNLKQLFLGSEFYLLHKIDLVIMKMALPVAAAGFALDKLRMTLTVFRENKNATARNLLIPLSDLGLGQRPRQRKEPDRVECKHGRPTEQKPSYSRLEDCQRDEGGT